MPPYAAALNVGPDAAATLPGYHDDCIYAAMAPYAAVCRRLERGPDTAATLPGHHDDCIYAAMAPYAGPDAAVAVPGHHDDCIYVATFYIFKFIHLHFIVGT